MTEPSAEDKIVLNDENESIAEEIDWKNDERATMSLASIYIGLGIDPNFLLNDNEAISEEYNER